MILRLLTAAVLIPTTLAAVFLSPLWLFIVFVSVLLGLSIWEFGRLLSAYDLRCSLLARIVTLMFPIGFALRPGSPWISTLIVTYLFLAIWSMGISSPRLALPSATANVFMIAYLGLPFGIALGLHPEGPLAQDTLAPPGVELLFVLVMVWVSDSAGYFVGRLVGKHKITPRLSPNKSLEGFLGALAGPSVAAIFFRPYFLPEWPTMTFVLLGLLLGLAAITGDLFESLMKRGSGLKDTSALLPGHGGILDRVDSLLFAYPLYFVATRILLAPSLGEVS